MKPFPYVASRSRLSDRLRHRAERSLTSLWYSQSPWRRCLEPLSWFFRRAVDRRRASYLQGAQAAWKAPVPVCVVGNITVGGTGKTPLVAWLSNWLETRGQRVGIVSRGHGGRAQYPMEVTCESSPDEVGDESLMLARRVELPIVVDPDRVRAVEYLLKTHKIDVILSDDGLQHYALARDLEIVVIDGMRGIGNGMLMPAGPLREPKERLESVDWVVANSTASGLVESEWVMQYRVTAFVNVGTGQRMEPAAFRSKYGSNVQAVAAIGNPERFRQTLQAEGFVPSLSVFRDHHRFSEDDFAHMTQEVMVVTEKDAQKIRELTSVAPSAWYVEVEVEFDREVDQFLQELFSSRGIALESPA